MSLHSSKILLITLTSVALFIFSFKLNSSISNLQVYSSDFPNYYFAGQRWLNGEPVYQPIKKDVMSLLGWDNYIAYTADTPTTVIALSPLSNFGVEKGAWILNFISIILVSSSIFTLSYLCGFSIVTSCFYASLALSSVPFICLLEKVHMESLVLFLGVIGFALLRKRYFKISGIFWGIAAALKLFPILWLLPYAFVKEKRDVLKFGLASFILITALSVSTLDFADTNTFLLEIIPMSEIWYGLVGNYSLVSFLTAMLGRPYGKYIGLIFIVPLILHCYRILKNGNFSDEKAYSISTSAALLISPLSWINYLILVFPSLIFLSGKYTYYRLKNYVSLLLIFTAFWAWPDAIFTNSQTLTIILSFMPMFGLLSIILFYHKKL